jgi:flagellar M-ring protein FliF
LTNTQHEYQQTLEKDIETRIQTMLERIVGVNKAVVRVSSVVDFRKIETTEERYDPNGQVVRSEQRGQEKSNGVNGVSGGVPGVESNVPPGTEQEPAQTSSTTSQTKNETVNYEISRTVSRIVEPTGTIKKLSVAVLVDGIYEVPKPAEGEKTPAADTARKYQPRSAEEMARIEEIVKKAMGYSAERQDQVEVVNMQFGFGEDAQPAGVESVPEPQKPWVPYIRYAVGGVLFLLLLFLVVRPLLGMLAMSSASPASAETPALPASVGQVEASLAGGKPRAQIVDMARGNPDATAVVVKRWLKSGN